MNSFCRQTTICVVALLILCTISTTNSEADEKTDKPTSVSHAQEREKCQWGTSGQQQANDLIAKWMKDNQWTNPNIFNLRDKFPFQSNDYCAAYTWNADTDVWFYFKSNGDSFELVGFEKKPK